MLRGDEEVVPGGAERILAIAERQAAHRHRIESRGQLFGLSLAARSTARASRQLPPECRWPACQG